jgi:hypothetical protein
MEHPDSPTTIKIARETLEDLIEATSKLIATGQIKETLAYQNAVGLAVNAIANADVCKNDWTVVLVAINDDETTDILHVRAENETDAEKKAEQFVFGDDPDDYPPLHSFAFPGHLPGGRDAYTVRQAIKRSTRSALTAAQRAIASLWTPAYSQAALLSGWNLFPSGAGYLQIQLVDGSPFKSDRHLMAHLKKLAAQGDQRAVLALKIDDYFEPLIYPA